MVQLCKYQNCLLKMKHFIAGSHKLTVNDKIIVWSRTKAGVGFQEVEQENCDRRRRREKTKFDRSCHHHWTPVSSYLRQVLTFFTNLFAKKADTAWVAEYQHFTQGNYTSSWKQNIHAKSENMEKGDEFLNDLTDFP